MGQAEFVCFKNSRITLTAKRYHTSDKKVINVSLQQGKTRSKRRINTGKERKQPFMRIQFTKTLISLRQTRLCAHGITYSFAYLIAPSWASDAANKSSSKAKKAPCLRPFVMDCTNSLGSAPKTTSGQIGSWKRRREAKGKERMNVISKTSKDYDNLKQN